MEIFFKDIFTYHAKYNQLVADALITHEEVLPAKAVTVFSHMINAHQIWNCRLTTGTEIPLNQVHPLTYCKALDVKNMEQTMAFLHNANFNSIVNYKNTKGVPFSNTVQDILFHINNHTTHHRGQIIALFRAANIAPPITDYIYFKR